MELPLPRVEDTYAYKFLSQQVDMLMQRDDDPTGIVYALALLTAEVSDTLINGD